MVAVALGRESPIGETVVRQSEAATMLNVGKRTVERAVGTPELIQAVESGTVKVSPARPQEEQAEGFTYVNHRLSPIHKREGPCKPRGCILTLSRYVSIPRERSSLYRAENKP